MVLFATTSSPHNSTSICSGKRTDLQVRPLLQLDGGVGEVIAKIEQVQVGRCQLDIIEEHLSAGKRYAQEPWDKLKFGERIGAASTKNVFFVSNVLQ